MKTSTGKPGDFESPKGTVSFSPTIAAQRCPRKLGQSPGFTLIELLMVIVMIAILVGVMLPRSDPNIMDKLRSTAQIVSTELAYGRSLSMANGSTYKFTFNTTQNCFILRHSGTDTSLNKLPITPFRSPSDTLTQHVVNLSELPHIGPIVRLEAATTSGTSPQIVSDLEFNSLGATTRSAGTIVWLSAGDGSNTLYIPITVDPVIGTCQIGNYTDIAPP